MSDFFFVVVSEKQGHLSLSLVPYPVSSVARGLVRCMAEVETMKDASSSSSSISSGNSCFHHFLVLFSKRRFLPG